MKKKILVVDDDEAIVEVIKLILEDQGYAVITSDNGNIFQLLDKEHPDVILLDVLLSGYDGREIARALKRDVTKKHIPILMISAHPTAALTASDSGADAFLSKPFEITDLLSLVAKYSGETTLTHA